MVRPDPLEWDELPPMMSVEECRRFLQIGDRQCRRWAKENDIYIKIGGSARIPKAGLATVLEGNEKFPPAIPDENELESNSG